MKRFLYHYPGDPVMEAVEYNYDEFLRDFPRTATEIITPETRYIIPIEPGLVLCDLCGKQLGPDDTIVVICHGSRGYCVECANISIYPNRIDPDRN